MSTTESPSLLDPWTGPFGGVPPWDRIDPDGFVDAFRTAIAETEAEMDAIAANDAEPTFDNTIRALERSGRPLARLSALFGVHASNLNRGPIPDIQRTVGPLLAAHRDRVVQHSGLFARVQAVAEGPRADLDEAQQRLVDDHHLHFVRNGAALDQAEKAELGRVNQRLASLYTDFSQNILDEESNRVVWITDPDKLDGLPASLVESLADRAAEHDRPDAWAVAVTRSAVEPVLTSATDRDLRAEVWRSFYSRAEGVTRDDGTPGPDNRPIMVEILQLRARRAQLLGYEGHAQWQLENSMAATPEAALSLLMDVWPRAAARAREEAADMEAMAGHPIEPWDQRFWANKVRRERYRLDSAELEPYLQLEKMIEAMLWCATELYGLSFRPVDDGSVPVFHPDVRVWDVTGPGGDHVALFYLDPYARPGKSSGAWMTSYRVQHGLEGLGAGTPLIANNSNFVKPSRPGKPVLVSWDDARTLFHEFGHALHGLLSKVVFPSQSGTSVYRDFVEFPSQLNEHWLTTDEVLGRFWVHHQTGEPVPAELVERIKRSETFNQGFDTVEYLAAALYDLRIHLASSDPDTEIDPMAFETELMAELDLPRHVVMRHRPTHFAHIFAGDGYSAFYYSYLWADALVADAAEAFGAAGGFFDADLAQRLHDTLLSVGDTVDPADAFRAFRGRDVDAEALLRKRGFTP